MYPKPNREAQAEVGGAKKVPLSDVYGTNKRNLFLKRSWAKVDVTYIAFMVFIHGLCLFAPMTFSWPMVGAFFASYLVTGTSLFLVLDASLLGANKLNIRDSAGSVY